MFAMSTSWKWAFDAFRPRSDLPVARKGRLRGTFGLGVPDSLCAAPDAWQTGAKDITQPRRDQREEQRLCTSRLQDTHSDSAYVSLVYNVVCSRRVMFVVIRHRPASGVHASSAKLAPSFPASTPIGSLSLAKSQNATCHSCQVVQSASKSTTGMVVGMRKAVYVMSESI